MKTKIVGPPTTALTLAEYAKAKLLPEHFLKKIGLSEIKLRDKVAVEIPYMNEDGEVGSKRFRLSMDPSGPRFAWRTGSKPCLYGLWRLANARKTGYICIVEGESDAQTLWLHKIPALGLPGANTWKEEWAHYLEGIKKIFVVVEPDRGGEAVLKRFARSTIRNRVCLVKLNGAKDPSELYLKNPKRFRKSWDDAISNSKPWASIEKEMDEKLHSVPNNGALPYVSTPAGIIWHKPVRDGEEEVRLTNFTARIIADIAEDDGVESKHSLEIEAKCNGRARTFGVPASGFTAMNWPLEELGGGAIIAAGAGLRDHARAAVQSLSSDMDHRRVFLHTGWRRIEDQWCYLHAGGAIGAEGSRTDLNVKLPPHVAAFDLPPAPVGKSLRSAIRASVRFLGLAPWRIIVPIYAAIWRSVLTASDFSLHLTGPTGTFKSCVAALAMQHFGAGFDYLHLPGNWNSTANTNAHLQFVLKDSMFVIDDFVPQGSQADVQRMHRDADRVFRGQGNNAGRGRMARDTSLRNPTPPRGFTLSTGEEVPRGESLKARVWLLDFSKGDIDVGKLTRCQRDADSGLYAQAMAGYLRWLAPEFDEQQRWLGERVAQLREEAMQEGQHRRTPSTIANLGHGFFVFLLFAMRSGVITWQEVKTLNRRAWRALEQAAEAQTSEQAAEDPARRFLNLIAAVLTRGDGHLGYADLGGSSKDAKGKLIGWTAARDGEEFFLLEPEASFAAANHLAQEQGISLPVGQTTLWKRLRERGFLVRHEEGRNLMPWLIGGARRRVLCLRKNALPFTDRAQEG